MNAQRLNEVMQILSKDIYKNGVPDYYNLFDLNINMSIEELQNEIKKKKLRVLFHPDQIKSIPAEYQQKYLQMIEITTNMINTFDNRRNKENYDNQLKQVIYSNKTNDSSNKTEDLEAVYLKEAIFGNVKKYGFDFTKQALFNLLRKKSLQGFTRDNDIRDTVGNIAFEKISEIVGKSSLSDIQLYDSLRLEEIIMNYLTDLVRNNEPYCSQLDSLEKATATTICKYDLQGYPNHTYQALSRFMYDANASSFTNDNNARIHLISSGVDPRNMNFLLECALISERTKHPEYRYANIMDLTPNCISKYYEMIQQKVMNNVYQEEQENYGYK